MKKNTGKYTEVTKLPASALTVAEYAKQSGFTTNYIYNLLKKGKNKGRFNVVIFQSFNFIVPIKAK